TTYGGPGLMLILALGLAVAGFVLIRIALRQARRDALFSATFWATFPEFARYRLKRLGPAVLGLAGAILLMWGLVLLFQWVLAYYAARMGHPFA
ncbi:MAG: hypothetical protein M3Z28_10570, partial [Candidatus Dormibacteraeota bacterium]|nr:hypothetical protein [Candidatus Dormibacteraeota bacterium]